VIYNLSIQHEREQAKTRFQFLLDNSKKIDLKVKHPKKSVSHNAYAHLLFSWFALEYGETMAHIKKEMFKKIVNPDLFLTEYVNKKTGEIRQDLRSFADLDSGETTIAIDRFRTWSSKEAGIYLPEPSDLIFLEEIEKQINNNDKYL